MFAFDAAHNAAEGHVDGSREKGWRDEDKEVLNNVWHQFTSVVDSTSSGTVAYDFDYLCH